MNLDQLQDEVRRIWTGEAYSPAFDHVKTRGLPHIDSTHTALHISKAAGKIAAAVEPADHGGEIDRAALGKALADLLICSARLANVLPKGPLDLLTLVTDRLGEIAGRQKPEDHQAA